MQNGIALFHRFSLLTLQLRFRSHFPLNGRTDSRSSSRFASIRMEMENQLGTILFCVMLQFRLFFHSLSREHAAHTKVKPIPHRIWYQVVSFFIVPPDFAPQCRGEIFGLEIDVEGELQNFVAQEFSVDSFLSDLCFALKKFDIDFLLQQIRNIFNCKCLIWPKKRRRRGRREEVSFYFPECWQMSFQNINDSGEEVKTWFPSASPHSFPFKKLMRF